MIDLLTTPEEQEIADTVSRMLSEKYPVSRFRVPVEHRPSADDNIVADLAELGFSGLGVPEAAGGLGLAYATEVLAFREYGRFLVSPAILGSVIAAHIAAQGGHQALVDRILAGITYAGVAIAAGCDDQGRLGGEVQLFEAGPDRHFVFWNDKGAGLYDATSLDCRSVRGLDETLNHEITQVSGLEPVHWVDASSQPLSLLGTLFVAAMKVGMCEAVRDMAVEYARTRIQFGQPIGHFQAVKHKCADMALYAEAAWCETVYAALDLQQDGAGAAFHVLNAKMLAADAIQKSAKDNIQIHGGMGYTTEVPAHHFMKRAHVLREIGGNVRQIQNCLLDLPVLS